MLLVRSETGFGWLHFEYVIQVTYLIAAYRFYRNLLCKFFI